MKSLILPLAGLLLIAGFGNCNSSSKKEKKFCETRCLKDTLKFTGDHKLKPYVYLSVKDCKADSLIWSYSGLGANRMAGLFDLLNTTIDINSDYFRCEIPDTSYAWLFFNDCATGRGYQIKLPFNKTSAIGRKSSAINNLDPKFEIDNSLAAYTDRGNIYVEDIATGKTAMMTFGKNTGMDYDAIHEYLDSVNVTRERIWVKVKIDEEWKELEKKISLE